MKVVGIVILNFLIVLSIVMVLNLAFAARGDLRRYSRQWKADPRATLPGYPDPAVARLIYKEFAELRTGYIPFAGWSRLPYAGEVTTIGADGDRVHVSTAGPDAGEVHFFGGSTTWGTGVVDSETIPAYFDRLFPAYHAINHGESAFNSRQGLAKLVEIYRHGVRPDLVIFYDGANDVVHNCRAGNGSFGMARASMMRQRVAMPRFLHAIAGNFLEKLDGVRERFWPDVFIYEDERAPCFEVPEYAERVVDGLFASWKIAQQLVHANGGEFIAILQPVAAIGSPRVDYLDLRPDRARIKNLKAIYPLLVERLAHHRSEGATWMLDFSGAFDGDRALYVDYCHVVGEGNRIIAERIAEVAGDRLLSRR